MPALDDGLAGDVNWRKTVYVYLFVEKRLTLLGRLLGQLILGLAEMGGDRPPTALLRQVFFFFRLPFYL